LSYPLVTKFALEGLSKTIAYELSPWIKMILIESGAVGNSFTEESVLPESVRSAVALLKISTKGQRQRSFTAREYNTA
jgi:hypothetical protein